MFILFEVFEDCVNCILNFKEPLDHFEKAANIKAQLKFKFQFCLTPFHGLYLFQRVLTSMISFLGLLRSFLFVTVLLYSMQA